MDLGRAMGTFTTKAPPMHLPVTFLANAKLAGGNY